MAKPVAARGFARERVVEAALELFAQHGIRGTSFQMIASRLGVTKASVYYQFQSKDDIVLAVTQPLFDDIEHVQRIADVLTGDAARRDVALSGLIDLAIRHRRLANVVYGDPVMVEMLTTHERLRAVVDGFTELLTGTSRTRTQLVAMALLTGGIYGCTADTRLADFSDAELRSELEIVVKLFTENLDQLDRP